MSNADMELAVTARRVADRMRRLAPRARVQLETYPGLQHSACPDEVAEIRAFLQVSR